MSCVGGHVSVAGGLIHGILKANEIGAKAIQIFGSSPRRWACRLPNANSIEDYKDAKAKSKVRAVFLHAPYLVNLVTTNDEIFLKSIKVLIEHMQIAEMIGADGLIFHIGSMQKDSLRIKVLNRAVKGMKMVLKHAPGKTNLIMENAAGGITRVGSNFDDLAFLYNKMKSSRIKICLDTAHLFEAGLIDNYSSEKIKRLFDEFEKKIGISNLAVLHINDSKTAFNSHHDRHENIGDGYIGIKGFKNLAREKRINEIPWILEVPGFNNHGVDKKNIRLLNSCF